MLFKGKMWQVEEIGCLDTKHKNVGMSYMVMKLQLFVLVLCLFVKCLSANYSYYSIYIGLVIITGMLNQCYLVYINLFSSISYIVNECFCLTYVIYYVSVFN